VTAFSPEKTFTPSITRLRPAMRAAFFLLTCMAPRRELHGLHAGTRFSSPSEPPLSTSMMWSASVAGALRHQWQAGLSSRITLRLRLYSGVCVRAILVLSLAPLRFALRLLSV